MTPRPQDGAARLLAVATIGLPPYRSEWGTAMRAELAAIEDAGARRQFARSAALAAFAQGLGVRVGLVLLAGILVAAIPLIASRLQLADGGPGILGVTVSVPALVLLLISLVSAGLVRSFRGGVETGFAALLVGFAALFAVLAVEGLSWMDRLGVFLLDGDPPTGVVDTADIVFNIFSTGMWVGHVVLWVPAVLIGAALGTWIGGRIRPAQITAKV